MSLRKRIRRGENLFKPLINIAKLPLEFLLGLFLEKQFRVIA
jgi:hypothetical protein